MILGLGRLLSQDPMYSCGSEVTAARKGGLCYHGSESRAGTILVSERLLCGHNQQALLSVMGRKPPQAMEAIQQNSNDVIASCLSWGILLHTFASCRVPGRLCVGVVTHESRQVALKEQQAMLRAQDRTAWRWETSRRPGYPHVQS